MSHSAHVDTPRQPLGPIFGVSVLGNATPCACVRVSESRASLEGAGVAGPGPGPVEKPSQAKPSQANDPVARDRCRP